MELTLIQLAQLTTEGEEVPGGRGPQTVIKPINPQPQTAAPQQARPVQDATAHPAQPAQPKPTVQAPPQTATAHVASVLAARKAEEKKVPVMAKGGLGISIKQVQVEEKNYEAASATVPVQVSEARVQPEEDYMFNERDVNYYWQEYAGRLPHEQVAVAKRMQNLRLTLLDATTFEVVVDTPIVAKEFADLAPAIQDYLRTRLKNNKVTMAVRVSAPEEKARAYGRGEQFQMMAEKNKALLELQDEFGLEFA